MPITSRWEVRVVNYTREVPCYHPPGTMMTIYRSDLCRCLIDGERPNEKVLLARRLTCFGPHTSAEMLVSSYLFFTEQEMPRALRLPAIEVDSSLIEEFVDGKGWRKVYPKES